MNKHKHTQRAVQQFSDWVKHYATKTVFGRENTYVYKCIKLGNFRAKPPPPKKTKHCRFYDANRNRCSFQSNLKIVNWVFVLSQTHRVRERERQKERLPPKNNKISANGCVVLIYWRNWKLVLLLLPLLHAGWNLYTTVRYAWVNTLTIVVEKPATVALVFEIEWRIHLSIYRALSCSILFVIELLNFKYGHRIELCAIE